MKVLKKIISCIMVVALLFATLFFATNLFQKKESDTKYHQFFEHAEDFDVLFIGSSHVINGILPLELFNDYGITSYNFGGHSAVIPTSYWILKNALDYAKPKVVVVDCFSLHQQIKTSKKFEYVHLSLDAFSLSKTKIQAVNDLLDDKEIQKLIDNGEIVGSEKRTKLGLLWNYSVYHARWDEIDKGDFIEPNSIEYGAESRVSLAEPGEENRNTDAKLSEETVGIQYLKRIIEECKNNDIDVLLTFLPYPVEGDVDWAEINTAYEIANNYGINYIDFHSLDVVDYNTDVYDSYSHLNISGALKVTDYLGKYLKNNYQLLDRRQDSHYEYWHEDYKKYEETKNIRLSLINDLNTYLMTLSDKNYGYIISVGDSKAFEDDTTIALLRNKGVKVEEINENTRYIIVCGDVTQVINSYINDYGDYGEVSIYFGEDSKYGIYKDGQEINYLDTDTLSIIDGALYISVFDLDNKNEIVDVSTFKKHVSIDTYER